MTTAVEHGLLDVSTRRSEDGLVRRISHGDVAIETHSVDDSTDPDLDGAWWKAYLKGIRPVPLAHPSHPATVRTIDLFSGPGGLALGFSQAAAELGMTHDAAVAIDQDAGAVGVYGANHSVSRTWTDSVSMLVDYQIKGNRTGATFLYEPEMVGDEWADIVGNVDVVLAGPPCQGHSNLNNRSRRTDSRNELYLTVPAVALAVGADSVIIENVPSVIHDHQGVVQTTIALLEDAGFTVETGVLKAEQLGWAQNRSRFFLVASRRTKPIPLSDVSRALGSPARNVLWAISGASRKEGDHLLVPAELNEDNVRRIDWLFDNDEYDLALDQRPECHQQGTTYKAVYGRLYPDRPSPTITTGFMTPGRGRYIHPTERRTISAREAARLQGFPDTYEFVVDPSEPPSRTQLAKWIGDAVPMPLGYAAGLSVLLPKM